MAVSRRTVSLVRSLAIFHIVVGALLIILGIADGVTSLATAGYVFWTGYVFFGVWIGTWAGVFMGFSITSAVLGGIIIIFYSIMFANARYSRYYDLYRYGYRYKRYSYSAKMALAAVILTLGIVEFGTGIWVSICLCFMKPCCTDSEQQTEGGNAVTQGVDGVPVVIPLQGPGVTFQTQPFYSYPPAGQAAIGGPIHFQAVGNQPQFVVMPAAGGGFPPQYTE
ncbi:hypothetical protein P5673_030710, partial [Acropora cervicornis]